MTNSIICCCGGKQKHSFFVSICLNLKRTPILHRCLFSVKSSSIQTVLHRNKFKRTRFKTFISDGQMSNKKIMYLAYDFRLSSMCTKKGQSSSKTRVFLITLPHLNNILYCTYCSVVHNLPFLKERKNNQLCMSSRFHPTLMSFQYSTIT